MNGKGINKFLLKIAVIFFVCFSPIMAIAIPDCNNPDTNACPIDNGVWFLLAAGIGYGVLKYMYKRKTAVI